MDVVRQARFSSAFTFIYSPRPGTPAAAMEQIPRDVVQDRFDRLVALQEQITEENLATFEGRDVEVMITGKLGKKDTDTHRVTGREKTGVLVHIGVPEGEPVPEIGDFVTATVTHAGRHNLLADRRGRRPDYPCGTEGAYMTQRVVSIVGPPRPARRGWASPSPGVWPKRGSGPKS